MKLSKFTISLVLMLFAAGAAWADNPPWPADDLTFTTHDKKQFSLAAQKGKPVAVMFFSTDCPHCQQTAQLLEPIYAQYKAKGVEIVALAVNPSAAANLGEFVQKYKVAFPIGLGTSAQWTKFAHMPFGARAYVPHMLFVDKNGTVVEDHPGADRSFWTKQETAIRETFDRLLK